jgi:CRISPR-associated protein Csm2
MPSSVFSFKISDLDSVYDRNQKDKDKEVRSLRGKFAEWDLAPEATVQLTADSIRAIITAPEGTPELVKWAEKLGYILKALQLSTSQIRNIFGTVRQIEMDWERPTADNKEAREAKAKQAARRLSLLRPKLAYQAGRQQGKGKEGVQALTAILTPAIALVGEDRACFEHFVDFFEAILAYHTAAGGQQ